MWVGALTRWCRRFLRRLVRFLQTVGRRGRILRSKKPDHALVLSRSLLLLPLPFTAAAGLHSLYSGTTLCRRHCRTHTAAALELVARQ